MQNYNVPKDSALYMPIVRHMKTIDFKNQTFISNLLDKCSWPVGLDYLENNTIFLVIDHADTIFMNKYFSLIKAKAKEGVVARSDFATLEDRILMRRNQKQIYGTQSFSDNVAHVTKIWPIEDDQNLNERRKEMGLMAMDKYIELLKTAFGNNAIWDKTLTIDDAKKRRKKQ